MRNRTILDKNINDLNYANFKASKLLDSGRKLQFVYANGDSYIVPLEYAMTWFNQPHYKRVKGRRYVLKEINYKFNLADTHISSCRMVGKRHFVRINLSNGYVYDIAWDTVLMACEPLYEHFGGLTDESKKITKEWHENHPGAIVKFTHKR